MAKMKCPENCGGCYVGGNEYVADKKGFITVPDEFVESLKSHGYEVSDDKAKSKPADDEAPKAE